MFITIIISAILLYLIWNYFQNKKDVRLLPPEYTNRYPIIGCAHLFLFADTKRLFTIMKEMGDFGLKNGKILRGCMGPFSCIGMCNPDDCLTLMNTCLEKNWLYDFMKPWLGDSIITTSNIPKWKYHRKILNRGFAMPVLESYIDIYNKQAKLLVKRLAEKVGNGPFDQLHVLEIFFLELMYQTTLGFSEDDVKGFIDKEHSTAIRTMLNIIAKRFLNVLMHSDFLYRFTALKKQQDEVIKVLHGKSDLIIEKKREMKRANKSDTPSTSFLDIFLDMSESGEGSITDEEIKADVDTLILAGSDTMATIMTFALTLLGSHKDIQDKVYEEITQFLDDTSSDVNKHDLPKLSLLEAVLWETMRLYPAVPILARYISRDTKLGKYTIPAGTNCFVFAYHMHRDPDVWGPDANEFCPTRWTTGRLPKSQGAFAMFSIGKRGCIGKTQALMAMKVILSHVLLNYEISADVNKVELQLDTLLKPAEGHFIDLKAR